MGTIAWIAPGMAAALLANMLLPAKDHGRLFSSSPPGRIASPVDSCDSWVT